MRRWLLAFAVGVAALVLPTATQAELVVSGPSPALGGTGTTVAEIDPGGPMARLVLLAPPGFDAELGRPPGTTIGSAEAVLETSGTTDGPLVVATGGAACGSEGHEALWRLELDGGGELLVAVDAVAPPDPAAGYASYRLEACAPDGVRISSLVLRLEHVFTNPGQAGEYAWRALGVPGGAGGAPAPELAVESRSTQTLPVRLTLHGAFDRARGRAMLSGLLTAAGSTVAGAEIALFAGRRGSSLVRAGSATTGSQGGYSTRRTLRQTTRFEARAQVPASADPAGCPQPIVPGGCASATLAPVEVTSRRVTVRVPVLRTLRLGARGADVRHLRAELARLRYLPPGSGGARFDERTWHAVIALQGWLGLGRTGVVDRRTWRALARAGVPAPWARLRRGILIDTARQVMLLVDGGRTVRAIHVSTGAYGRTPHGRFAVYRKEVLSWSVPFSTWMPYASYFVGGFAMHSYPSVPSYAASHGCVRLPPVEAPGIYRFASYGTPVWIR